MNRKFLFIPLIPAFLLMTSCEKDWIQGDSIKNESISNKNYTQLKVGNYWIYERFDVSANGVSTSLGIYDSCYIEKDTVINNKVYFKMFRPNPFAMNPDILFWRDSLHYLVDHHGTQLFSYIDFYSVFESYYFVVNISDTVCLIERNMDDFGFLTSTPAGMFESMNSKLSYYMYLQFSAGGNYRYRSTRYAENIGIVCETLLFYTAMPSYTERRLVSYHLN